MSDVDHTGRSCPYDNEGCYGPDGRGLPCAKCFIQGYPDEDQ